MPKDTPYHAAAREVADCLPPTALPCLGTLSLHLAQIASRGSREETMAAIQYIAACADYALHNWNQREEEHNNAAS